MMKKIKIDKKKKKETKLKRNSQKIRSILKSRKNVIRSLFLYYIDLVVWLRARVCVCVGQILYQSHRIGQKKKRMVFILCLIHDTITITTTTKHIIVEKVARKLPLRYDTIRYIYSRHTICVYAFKIWELLKNIDSC